MPGNTRDEGLDTRYLDDPPPPYNPNFNEDNDGFEPDPAVSLSSQNLLGSPRTDDPRDSSAPFESSYGDTTTDELLPQFPVIRYDPNGTNTFYTVFLIVNAALGAGLLNFPKSFNDAGGVWVAFGVQAVLLLFIIFALLLLGYCSDENNAKTLQETMEGPLGRTGKIITSVCVAVYCFGTTITFLVIIGDQFDRTFDDIFGHTFCFRWYLSRQFTIPASAVIFILPFCFSKKIDFLKFPSTIGVIAILYIVGLVIYEYFCGDYTPGPIKTRPDQWSDVFLIVPTICFGYQCHVSVIPIYSCMKHRTLKHFGIASVSAILICCFCYTGAAAFGCLTFGNKVEDDILTNYGQMRPEILIAIIAMTLKTFFTYPILLFCGREALVTLICDRFGITEAGETVLRYLIAAVWFLASLVLAVLIPNLGNVIKLLGSLAAVFIFIFPGLCLVQMTARSDPSCHRFKNFVKICFGIVFTALGAFIFGVVITQSIQSFFQTDSQPKLCYR